MRPRDPAEVDVLTAGPDRHLTGSDAIVAQRLVLIVAKSIGGGLVQLYVTEAGWRAMRIHRAWLAYGREP